MKNKVTLVDLVKSYNGRGRKKQTKIKEDPRYKGLSECFKNVRNCNVHGKLSYCL